MLQRIQIILFYIDDEKDKYCNLTDEDFMYAISFYRQHFVCFDNKVCGQIIIISMNGFIL